MSQINIKPLETISDFQAAEELQRKVWSGPDLEVVPMHVLTTVAHNGGVVIGAWDGERLVGFVFGFLGTVEGELHRPAASRLKHCSHMLGVLPEYRDQGVGYKLKLAQYEFVMQQGVRLITWTFDPLESRNAHLNIARLGAVCKTYKREVYGRMADGLNADLPTDRFQVDWWITSHRVKQRLSGERPRLSLQSFTSAETPILNPTRLNTAGLRQMIGEPDHALGVLCLVEVPADFQEIKAKDFELAHEWKDRIRSIFEAAFADGYIVTDFVFETGAQPPRAFYVLSQGGVRIIGEP